MQWPQCRPANPNSTAVCSVCGSLLSRRCLSCGADSPITKRYGGDCGAPLTAPGFEVSSTPSVGQPSVVHPAGVIPPFGAERRQITVMFCDLVGSTALSSRLDPE